MPVLCTLTMEAISVKSTVYSPSEYNSADKRGREGRYKIAEPGGPEEGPGPHYVAYIFDFLGSVRCNHVVICRIDGTCGQRPSCVRCCLLCLRTFPIAARRSTKKFFHRGPNPLSAALRKTNYLHHQVSNRIQRIILCVLQCPGHLGLQL
jgi:hypothetical protein